MTQNKADSNASYQTALREMGEALTDLKRRRGVPSYDRLRARGTKLFGEQCSSSKATMSNVFGGRQYLALDKLMWLVRTMLSYQDGEESSAPTRDNPILEPWRTRWYNIDALRTAARRQLAAAPSAGPAEDGEASASTLPNSEEQARNPSPSSVGKEAEPPAGRRQSRDTPFVSIRRPFNLDALSTDGRKDVAALALSPDGWVAAVGPDQVIQLWAPKTATGPGRPLEGARDGAVAIAFSPEGQLRTLCDGRVLREWDPETHFQVTAFLIGDKDGGATCGAFSPDGRLLATAEGYRGLARVWDLETREALDVSFSFPSVTAVAFSPDGLLATGHRDGSIRQWDLETRTQHGERLVVGLTPDEPVRGLAFSPDGVLLVTRDENGLGRVWDLETGKALDDPFPGAAVPPVTASVFSPDGLLATGHRDGSIRLWTQPAAPPVPSVALPLAARAALYGMHRGQPVELGARLKHDSPVLATAFAPDGRLATGASDGTVQLWDPVTRAALSPRLHHHGPARVVAFSPDGKHLAIADDYGVRLSPSAGDTDRGPYLNGNHGLVRAVAFSPDGQHLAIGDDNHVQMWDVRASAPLGNPSVHSGFLTNWWPSRPTGSSSPHAGKTVSSCGTL
ncbi:WD40 repeat domain-containing protein [Streptomyces longisporus]|uniref:Uncharacterized protein n=1 Tax=Streptomyces longisporus TaxID=1948 RepID=A0ABN3NKR8_STRLO